MGRDCKGKPHVHTAAVSLDRRVEKFFDFGERHDLIELRPGLGSAHAEDPTIKINVLASGQFWVKARADFKQAGDAALNADPAFRWFRNPAQDF